MEGYTWDVWLLTEAVGETSQHKCNTKGSLPWTLKRAVYLYGSRSSTVKTPIAMTTYAANAFIIMNVCLEKASKSKWVLNFFITESGFEMCFGWDLIRPRQMPYSYHEPTSVIAGVAS